MDVAQISAARREAVVGARSDGRVQLLLSRHRQRPPSRSAPSFAAAGFATLAAPFRDGLEVLAGGPGEAALVSRLTVGAQRDAVPVHWELARDPHFGEPERYGLLLAAVANDFTLRVRLSGLEPGHSYWARCWAGGHWSRTARVHSASHQTPRLSPTSTPTHMPAARGWQRSAS